LFTACLAGYTWLYFSITKNITENKSVEICFIKHLTNIPCPSCGATRSILTLTKGNLTEAFNINPMGFLIAFIMLLAPLWIIVDITAKKNTLFAFYQKTESYLKRPQLAIPLVIIVIINWIWNITKGL
jgi:hypothetical protein